MLYLRALGGLSLENGGRPLQGAANQRARLALLTVLAVAGDRGISRDRLLALFWPEKDTEAAHGALRQALYTLRRDAEEPGLTLGTADLRLNRHAINSDVGDFDAAMSSRDFVAAVDCYGGPLLDGIYLRDVPELALWVEHERDRRVSQYRIALEQLARAATGRGDDRSAVEWYSRLASSDSLNARVAVSLMKALAQAGDRPAAVRYAREYERRVRVELEVAPDPSVVALADEIRATIEVAISAREVAASPSTDIDSTTLNTSREQSPGRRQRGRVAATIAGVVFVVLLAGFVLPRALRTASTRRQTPGGIARPTEAILVADIRVTAADSALGGVVTEALRTGLGQSTTLTVVPQSAVTSALERMQRPANSRVSLPLAREIAQREGIRLVVDGDVTPLAGGSVLSVRLVAAASGDEMTSYRESVTGAKDLIPALDRVIRALRAEIGESLASVNASPPLERVTTPSLAALQKYVEGTRAQELDVDYHAAVRLLREAVALDTSFAMAYRKLGTVLKHLGRPRAECDSAFATAYRFRDRLTDEERLHTTAYYYLAGPGRDRARAAAVYEELLSKYPDNPRALNDLGYIYNQRREYARAESVLRRSPRASGIAYEREVWNPNLVAVLFHQGKTAAAESALAHSNRFAPRAPQRFELALPIVQASYGLDSVAHFLDAGRNDPDPLARASAMRLRGEVALARGQLSKARALWDTARTIDLASGVILPEQFVGVKAAWIDAWFRGRTRGAVATLDAAMGTPLRDASLLGEFYFRLASVYALAGHPEKARAIMTRYRAEVRDSAQRRDEEPASHEPLAEIALAEKRPLDAVREFRRGETAPDGPAHPCAVCTYAGLARAFDAATMPDSAILYLERYGSTPYAWRLSGSRVEASVDAANLASVYRRLAELYEGAGNREKARENYVKFVELWQDADPELQPEVVAARARLALLSAEGKR